MFRGERREVNVDVVRSGARLNYSQPQFSSPVRVPASTGPDQDTPGLGWALRQEGGDSGGDRAEKRELFNVGVITPSIPVRLHTTLPPYISSTQISQPSLNILLYYNVKYKKHKPYL